MKHVLLCLLLSAAFIGANAQAPPSHDFKSLFDEIHRTVQQNFFDPTMRGVDWGTIGREHRVQLEEITTLDDFALVVNRMLATLNTSHTRLYTAREPEFFQLRDIFGDANVSYPGIGIITTIVDGETFIIGVLEGAPAHDAGLRLGDRIVMVEGSDFHPIDSFAHRVGEPTTIKIQRHLGQPPMEIKVTPQMLVPHDMFTNAIRKSARVIHHGGRKVAYVHMWSWAGDTYRQALRELLQRDDFATADALVLDVRDGWGGANPDEINLFSQTTPSLTFIDREGNSRPFDTVWRKPVVLLVNQGTRSGKEVITHAFKKHGIGPIVGERTAGAVIAGRPIRISDEIILYLAVSDIRVDDERLEGVGVTPDIHVPFDPRYAAGEDPQLQASIEAAAALVDPKVK